MFFVVLKLFLGLKERLVNTIHECLSLNFSEIISINMKEARKLRTKSLRKSPRTCVSIKFDLKRLCQSICKGIFCGFWNTSVYSSENLTAFSTLMGTIFAAIQTYRIGVKDSSQGWSKVADRRFASENSIVRDSFWINLIACVRCKQI